MPCTLQSSPNAHCLNLAPTLPSAYHLLPYPHPHHLNHILPTPPLLPLHLPFPHPPSQLPQLPQPSASSVRLLPNGDPCYRPFLPVQAAQWLQRYIPFSSLECSQLSLPPPQPTPHLFTQSSANELFTFSSATALKRSSLPFTFS